MTTKRLIKFAQENFILILSALYIFSPIDFIPEALVGPFGLIDDAVVLVGLLVFLFVKFLFGIERSPEEAKRYGVQGNFGKDRKPVEKAEAKEHIGEIVSKD